MTTTAHEDQFTAGTQTIQPVLQPYSTEAILRRNIADAKKEMQRQAERAESYAETLRSIASYVGAGGYNADTVDAGVFEEKIRWGIGELIGMLDRANAELAKLAQQKPVAWMDAEGDTYKEEPPENWCPPHVPLYASFAHAMHKGATHCDDCGLTWLDDGLNPLGCPYCKDAVPAPAVPNDIIPEGDDFNGTTPHLIQCIESLVRLDAKGVLVPHGIGRDASKLLTAAANRLRQQAPAVPAEWREVMTELADDLSIELDMRYQSRSHYPSELRKYENEMQPVYRARALLQSTEPRP